MLVSAACFAWDQATPEDVALDPAKLQQARDYALTGGGSGFITRHGKLVMSWGDEKARYDLKSSTKSIGVTALGLALMDGRIALDDKAAKYHPTLAILPESNLQTGWIGEITIRHLATQTAGFEKPGGYGKLLFKPGTKWLYSDAGPNWLAECITLIYKRDLNDFMFERVFTPIGITPADLTWRKNSCRDTQIEGVMRREFGSGISASVDAMARIGLLYLNKGRWDGKQIIPESFVDMARTTVPGIAGVPTATESGDMGLSSNHYGLLWWNNADASIAGVPTDTCWSWGLYDSLIVVMPKFDIVVSRAGKSWKREQDAAHYAVLEPFLQPIAAAVTDQAGPPYPPSPVIKSITWAPKETIIRKAEGGDNWPITWADDDALYTAYGDGWGFEPKVEKKLSLGAWPASTAPRNPSPAQTSVPKPANRSARVRPAKKPAACSPSTACSTCGCETPTTPNWPPRPTTAKHGNGATGDSRKASAAPRSSTSARTTPGPATTMSTSTHSTAIAPTSPPTT